MFAPIIELFKTLPVSLPIIAFSWAVIWPLFKYIVENERKYALSDFEQLKKIEPEIEFIKTKGSLFQDMSFRSITVLKGFDVNEVEFLLSRKRCKVSDVRDLKFLKKSKILKVFFNYERGSYQDNFPNRPFIYLLLSIVVYVCYLATLVYCFNNWQIQLVSWNLVFAWCLVGLVQIPIQNNISTVLDVNRLRRETDLFVS